MTEENFKKILLEKIKTDFRLEILENPEILLQIENSPERKTIRIHSCFMNAPNDIIAVIVRTILGKKKRYDRKKLLKYARCAIARQTWHNIRVDHEGKVHNLKKMFDSLNEKYFNNHISSNITYGKKFYKRRTRSIVFGNYDPRKNLIRINKALDDQAVPEFFVRYIIFHEMLHASLYLSGTDSIKHSKRFKKMEDEYPEIKLAEKWKRENLHIFIQHRGKNV